MNEGSKYLRQTKLFLFILVFTSNVFAASSGKFRSLTVASAPALFKQLWDLGARGEMFRIADDQNNSGDYFAVENWHSIHTNESREAIFLNDRESLDQIKIHERSGIQIVVKSPAFPVAFAVAEDNTLFKLIARHVPSLSTQPYIGLSGLADFYLLEHELIHHADHLSGSADGLWNEIKSRFSLPEKHLESIYFYIVEAKAYQAECMTLQRSTRLTEWDGIPVRRYGGQQWREDRQMDLVRIFNSHYGSSCGPHLKKLRRKARELFVEHIPGYSKNFDRNGLWRGTSHCAALMGNSVTQPPHPSPRLHASSLFGAS